MEIYKISPFDIPNQTLMRTKDLSDHVYNILGNLCQINEYDEVDWLFLMPLDKVGKKKEALRNSNSQQNYCIKNLRVSTGSWKETHISSSCRTKTAEIQTQKLILQVAEQQSKLNSQPHKVFIVKGNNNKTKYAHILMGICGKTLI